MASIQLPIPSPLITSGSFTANVVDPGSGNPTSVIRTEDAWSVSAEWSLQGPVVAILGGTWRLQVALESIGNQGVEMVSPQTLVNYASGTLTGVAPNQTMSFSASVNFPPGTPSIAGAPDVAYHVSALLTYITPANAPGPFAAVVDLGLVQIFDSQLP